MHAQKQVIENFLWNSLGIHECADQTRSPWVKKKKKMPERLFLDTSKDGSSFS